MTNGVFVIISLKQVFSENSSRKRFTRNTFLIIATNVLFLAIGVLVSVSKISVSVIEVPFFSSLPFRALIFFFLIFFSFFFLENDRSVSARNLIPSGRHFDINISPPCIWEKREAEQHIDRTIRGAVTRNWNGSHQRTNGVNENTNQKSTLSSFFSLGLCCSISVVFLFPFFSFYFYYFVSMI